MDLPKVYTCKCGFKHTSIVVYQRHMEAVHNKLPVNICKICHEEFLGNDEFDKHLQFTHGTNHWTVNLASRDARRKLQTMRDNQE